MAVNWLPLVIKIYSPESSESPRIIFIVTHHTARHTSPFLPAKELSCSPSSVLSLSLSSYQPRDCSGSRRRRNVMTPRGQNALSPRGLLWFSGGKATDVRHFLFLPVDDPVSCATVQLKGMCKRNNKKGSRPFLFYSPSNGCHSSILPKPQSWILPWQ